MKRPSSLALATPEGAVRQRPGRAGSAAGSWQPMSDRAALLARLQENRDWDLAVIGGGAVGLGVALDAAVRGFSVVLVESHDFAQGTSSRATKLAHGGVRYLAQGDIGLVREALHERTALLHNAPHVAQRLPFVMPAYQWWERAFYGAGLKMYDALAGRQGLGGTEWLNAARTPDAAAGCERTWPAGPPARWRALLGRPVRRCPPGAAAGPHGPGARRPGAEPLRRHRAAA